MRKPCSTHYACPSPRLSFSFRDAPPKRCSYPLRPPAYPRVVSHRTRGSAARTRQRGPCAPFVRNRTTRRTGGASLSSGARSCATPPTHPSTHPSTHPPARSSVDSGRPPRSALFSSPPPLRCAAAVPGRRGSRGGAVVCVTLCLCDVVCVCLSPAAEPAPTWIRNPLLPGCAPTHPPTHPVASPPLPAPTHLYPCPPTQLGPKNAPPAAAAGRGSMVD